MPRKVVLPAPQARAAFALASLHGHGWAVALGVAGLSPEGMSIGQIRRVTRRHYGADCFPYPIDAPRVVGREVFHHTGVGGAGRLSWIVFADGAVTIEVHRPEGVAAAVLVSPDGYVTVEDPGAGVPLYTRHLEPVLQAVAALVRAACGQRTPE